MRPLYGVVTRGGRTLTIRLESGLVVTATNSGGYSKYDQVAVFYDYTRSLVVRMEAYDPDEVVKEFTDESDTAVLADEDEIEILPEPVNEDDSGALYQCSDGYWDPEEGVIVMEGESSIE